jgi:hypothetical protein
MRPTFTLLGTCRVRKVGEVLVMSYTNEAQNVNTLSFSSVKIKGRGTCT